MENPSKNIRSFFRGVGLVFLTIFIILILMLFTRCSVIVPHSAKDIPDKPTVWVVSEVDALEYRFGHGFVFYKIIPINPGGLNARYVWVMDYDGAFKVGDQVQFLKVKPTDIQQINQD